MAAKYNPGDPLNYVRWYWKDWRASTARACLSPLERGVYRELLDAHYSSPDCTIPDEDAMLAGLADVPVRVWMKMRENVLRWIPLVSPGKRQHPRCLAEWERSRESRTKVVEAGKKGGRAKQRNRSDARAPLEQRSTDAVASLYPSASEDSSEGIRRSGSANLGALGGPPVALRKAEAEPEDPPADVVPAHRLPGFDLRPGESFAGRLARIRAEKSAAAAELDANRAAIRANGGHIPKRASGGGVQ